MTPRQLKQTQLNMLKENDGAQHKKILVDELFNITSIETIGADCFQKLQIFKTFSILKVALLVSVS